MFLPRDLTLVEFKFANVETIAIKLYVNLFYDIVVMKYCRGKSSLFFIALYIVN